MQPASSRGTGSAIPSAVPPSLTLAYVADLARLEWRGRDDKRELLLSPKGVRVAPASPIFPTDVLERHASYMGLQDLVEKELRSRHVRRAVETSLELVEYFVGVGPKSPMVVIGLNSAVQRAASLQDRHGISMADAVKLVLLAYQDASAERGLDEQRLEQAARALRASWLFPSAARIWAAQAPSWPADAKGQAAARKQHAFLPPPGAPLELSALVRATAPLVSAEPEAGGGGPAKGTD